MMTQISIKCTVTEILDIFVGMIVGIALESKLQIDVSPPPSGISIVASSPPANSMSCILLATTECSIVFAISYDNVFGFPLEAFAFALSSMTHQTSPETDKEGLAFISHRLNNLTAAAVVISAAVAVAVR